ncbi:MAG: hypothetical protein HY554_07420 [Elusimicrobia bacterium]|nr:hypothetical protein [Elusimicrobiota bacterium]
MIARLWLALALLGTAAALSSAAPGDGGPRKPRRASARLARGPDAPGGGEAAERRELAAVLSSASPYYRETYEGLRETFPDPVDLVIMSEGGAQPAGARVVVAIGSKAVLQPYPAKSTIIGTMTLGARPRRRGFIQVASVGRPAAMVAKWKALSPELRSIAVPYASPYWDDYVTLLRRAAGEAGLRVHAERLAGPERLPEYLRSLTGVDGLWAPPDAELISASSFAVLRDFACARSMPFFISAIGLAERGATASIAPSYRELGKSAAAAAVQVLAGTPPPERVYPERLTTILNLGAASRCRVALGPEAAGHADTVLP